MDTKHKYWIVKIYRGIKMNTLFMTPLMKIKYTHYPNSKQRCRSLNCDKECINTETILDMNLSDCEDYGELIIYDDNWVIVKGPEQCELDTLNEESIYCKRMIANKFNESENHFETIMVTPVQIFINIVFKEGITTRLIFNILNEEYNKFINKKKEEKKKKEENTMNNDKKKSLVKFDQETFIPGCCYQLTDMLNSCRYVMLLKSYAENELVFTRTDGSEYKYRLDDPAIVINPTKKLSDGPSIRKSEYVVYKKDYSKVFDTKKLYQLHNKVSNRLYADFKFEHYSEKEHCFAFVRTKPDNTDSVSCVSVFVDDIIIRDIWEIKETSADICATMREEE